MKALAGKIAVVAGATRGAGRGIARMLGEAGSTVYVTGRSTVGNPATPNRPETIEETAEFVNEAGGKGIAVRVDHTSEDDVRQLFERVRNEQGKLDILVNNVWGGDDLTEWGTPFWELSMEKGATMLERAVFSHIITSRYGVPLMVEQKSGLVVEITDGDHFGYRSNLFFDLVKTSVIRLAYAMASELREHEITAVALTPGFLRSEAMLDHFGVAEANWQDAVKQEPDFTESETACYVGRAVAHLAADSDVFAKTGRVFNSWDLAHHYGFHDIDSRQPHWDRHLEKHHPEYVVKKCDDVFYKYWRGQFEPEDV
jgi:NAD(P)-dependent dehydrogenase (short-subunit alcohol dehydrogenase family)